jgi:hypothetical protein
MKVKYVPIAIFLGALSLLLSSYQAGYTNGSGGDDKSGAIGAVTCSTGGTCHSTSATAGITVTIELDSAGVSVNQYHGGGSYTVKLTGTNTTNATLPLSGFELATVKAAGAGTGSAVQAGNWGTLPTGVQSSVSNNGLLIAEHQVQLGPTTGTGATGSTYVRNIPWTAPAAGTGSVVLYGVVNAVNGDGTGNAADKWNSANKTIAEAGGPNGINDLSDKLSGFNAYPTLMSGNVTVAFDLKETAAVSAQLISMQGQLVKTLMSDESLSAGNINRSYDVNGISAGIYFVKLQIGNSSVVTKVVKQ